MKKILLFTSILFFAFSLSTIKAQTLDSVVTTVPIVCFGDLATITAYMTQTTPGTPVKLMNFKYVTPTFLVSNGSSSVTTNTAMNFTGISPFNYKMLMVDSIPFYTQFPTGVPPQNQIQNPTDPSIIGWIDYSVDGILLLVVTPTQTAVNSCNGDCDAAEKLTILGGTPPYSITINGITSVLGTSSIDTTYLNLCAGTYDATIVDVNGCSTTPTVTSFTIAESLEVMSIPTINNVSCFGGNDGSVSLSISGGVSPYNIDWFNVDENNMTEGNYLYEITDSYGCIYQNTVYVGQVDSLIVDINVIDLQCYNVPTGQILITIISGGVANFSYSWIGPNLFASNQQNINNLYAGAYTLTLTDANNCNIDYYIAVSQPIDLAEYLDIERSNYSTYNISCFNGNDGWITSSASGGYLPYTFLWSNGSTSNSIDSLTAGTYDLNITDGLGCQAFYSFPINEPLEPVSGLINSIYDYNGYDISCYGFNDGGINVIPNGGVPPYTYIWDNTQTLNPLPFQFVGMHQLSMYDNNGCPWEGYIILQEPDELIWNIDIYTDTCAKQVGKVDIQVSGGVPSYTYSWNISQPLPIAVQVPEGEYYIEIKDSNDCVINDTIVVTNLLGQEMDFTILTDFERLYEQLDNPIVFIDMSELAWQNALYWDWDFGDGTYGTDSIAFHSYQEIGEYDVLLQITTDYNCIDTLVKKVVIKEYDLFIPNAFSPNSNDNINKGFRSHGIGIDEFLMKIYTRWGESIYSTTNIAEEWNGKYNNSGEECQLGVYVYYIEVKDIFGETHKHEGQVYLIR